jgi:hypothetical protein
MGAVIHTKTPIETATRGGCHPYEDTALHPHHHKLDIIQEMCLVKDETFAQIYLSPSPYCEAFEETLNIWKWSLRDHQTAGLVFQQKGDLSINLHLRLAFYVGDHVVAGHGSWK